VVGVCVKCLFCWWRTRHGALMEEQREVEVSSGRAFSHSRIFFLASRAHLSPTPTTISLPTSRATAQMAGGAAGGASPPAKGSASPAAKKVRGRGAPCAAPSISPPTLARHSPRTRSPYLLRSPAPTSVPSSAAAPRRAAVSRGWRRRGGEKISTRIRFVLFFARAPAGRASQA